jgi:hypothetical protein
MKNLIGFLLIISVLLTSGCVGRALNDKTANHLMTVAVNPKVTYGPFATRNTTGKALAGGLGGIIGALISNAVTKEEDEAFTKLLQSETHLDRVAYDCVVDALKNDDYWSQRLVANIESADAVFDIMIFPYGFSTFGTKSGTAQPTFGLHIKLIDKNGTELWKLARGLAKFPTGLPRYDIEEYVEDLSRYDVAAAALCKELTPQFLNSRETS